MKKTIFGTVGFQILTLGLFSVVALGQTESAEKEKSKSFEEIIGDASKGLQTGSWVTLGNISHIMGNNVSVTGYQVASPAEPANAPYEDKGVEVQSESAIFLAGRTYSRKLMGRPIGSPREFKFEHSIQFRDDGVAVDNASCFFNNPPEIGKYKLDGNTVILDFPGVTGPAYTDKYTLSDDGLTLANEAGAVLTISLAGNTYSRKIGDWGRVFVHTVQFKDDETVTVTDKADSFGNLPAINKFQIAKFKIAKGAVVIDLGDGKTESYQLSKDLKTLTNKAGAVLMRHRAP